MACKKATTKVMRAWKEYWHEEKTYRHLTQFSLRRIRRNRLVAMMGIWQYDWAIGRREKALVAQQTARSNSAHMRDSLRHLFGLCERKQRLRTMVSEISTRRAMRAKSEVVAGLRAATELDAWLKHRIRFLRAKSGRTRQRAAISVWRETLLRGRAHRGLVSRTQRYQRRRRLAQAMDEWAAAELTT